MSSATRQAGQRLRASVHVARARAGIDSDTALALAAGVHYDTLMNWYSGKTTPRPAELRKVAAALGARLSDLMDAYDGREAEAPPLHVAIRELIVELRADRLSRREEIADLVRAIRDAGHGHSGNGVSVPSTSTTGTK